MKKRIAGILMIVLSLGALGFWELWGREHISYREIAVLKDNVEANTVITEEMLSPQRVETATKGAIPWSRAGEIIGLETRQFVCGDLELHKEYFGEPKLRTGQRFDRYMLMIPDTWIMSMPESMRRGDRAFFYLGEKLICDTVVAHVKDSYGQEIVDSESSRFYPTGTIKTVEIIVSAGQMEDLNRLAAKGNRFTVIYSESDNN